MPLCSHAFSSVSASSLLSLIRTLIGFRAHPDYPGRAYLKILNLIASIKGSFFQIRSHTQGLSIRSWISYFMQAFSTGWWNNLTNWYLYDIQNSTGWHFKYPESCMWPEKIRQSKIPTNLTFFHVERSGHLHLLGSLLKSTVFELATCLPEA